MKTTPTIVPGSRPLQTRWFVVERWVEPAKRVVDLQPRLGTKPYKPKAGWSRQWPPYRTKEEAEARALLVKGKSRVAEVLDPETFTMQFAKQERAGGPYFERIVTRLVYHRFYAPEYELIPGNPAWVVSAEWTGRSYKLAGVIDEVAWDLMKNKDPRIKAMVDPSDFTVSVYQQEYGPVWKKLPKGRFWCISDGLWSEFLKVGHNGNVLGVGPAPQTEEELMSAFNNSEFQNARRHRNCPMGAACRK